MGNLGGQGVGGWSGCGQVNAVERFGWHGASAGEDWRTRGEYGEIPVAVHLDRVGIENGRAIVVTDLADGEKRPRGKVLKCM